MLASLKSNALAVCAVTSTRSVEFRLYRRGIVISRGRVPWPLANSVQAAATSVASARRVAGTRRCMTVGIRWVWYAIRPSIIDHQLWPPRPNEGSRAKLGTGPRATIVDRSMVTGAAGRLTVGN